MRFVLAVVLAAHGVAYFVGFVASWQLATLAELPYKTTILAGRLDVGDAGTLPGVDDGGGPMPGCSGRTR